MANGKGGFAIGFGVSLSTGAILAVAAGAALGTALMIHKHKKMHHHHMQYGHGGHQAYFSHEDNPEWALTTPSPSGMVPANNSIGIGDMVFRNIHHRCKNKHQVESNIHTILGKIRGYEVMLRPLLQSRMDGRITEHEYQKRLRRIIDHIAHELQIPMHKGHHILRPDLINHDGSTDDTDTGGEGWYSLYRTPMDKHHWRTHHNLTFDEMSPKIQDYSARQHFSAFTDIKGDEGIQHIPLARANNVEALDDYGYNSARGFELPTDADIQGVFTPA